MKSLIKSILYHIKSICELLIIFIKQICRENFKNYNKEEHIELPVYILGNGPSLLEFEHKTSVENICVVNYCGLSDIFYSLKPKYYVLADPHFFVRPFLDDKTKELFDKFKSIDWEINLYIPYYSYKITKKELITNRNINIIPYHTNEISECNVFKNIRNKIINKGLVMPKMQNVMVPSIINMINKGFKLIFLYGVEHSWTQNIIVNDDNIVCLRDSHYYNNNENYEPWLKNNGEYYKMHEVLRDLANMFSAYHTINEYANYKNATIINKTKKSYIDAFKKQ